MTDNPENQPIDDDLDDLNEDHLIETSSSDGNAATEEPNEQPHDESHWVQLLSNNDQHDSHAEAIEQLVALEKPTASTRSLLEQTAAHHTDESIRLAACQALASAGFRKLQSRQSRISLGVRRVILAEIEQWVKDGLLDEAAADLLEHRYNFDIVPQMQTKSAAKDDEPSRTLAEILLGETAIKTALYLGAFFVIAAACFFATAVEQLRLPILSVATLGFFAAAIGVKRRLPQVSFIFALIFSFLIATDGIVLEILYPVIADNSYIFWAGVTTLLGMLWLGGTWFYQSKIFSVLSLLGFSAAAFSLGRWFDQELHLDLFLIALPIFASLVGVLALRRWQEKSFALPLFWTAQSMQLGLLAASVSLFTADEIFGGGVAGIWWVVVGVTWFLAAGFYVLSNWLQSHTAFRALAVLALIPVPTLLINALSITVYIGLFVGWGWGMLLAAGSEAAYRLQRVRQLQYHPLLLGASVIVFVAVALVALDDTVWLGIMYLLLTAVVYFVLAVLRPRGWVFAGTLVATTLAYFAVFYLPVFDELEGFFGFVALWPPLILLGGYLVSRRVMKVSAQWYMPLLITGLIFGALNVVTSLIAGEENLLSAAIVFFVWSIFAAIFSFVEWRPLVGYAVTASMAIALQFVIRYMDQETWVLPFVGLALLFYLAGLAVFYLSDLDDWGHMLRWSGLGLGVLVSLSAPIQGGAMAIIGVAVIALLFTVEAFSKRNVWYGIPANLLYLLAYCMTLFELDVIEPQYYSIGAALIGIIMHYFLVRSGSKISALITGIITQLILLGTTYIQMISTERLVFFVVLFLQALVLLVYGLVVRSRSFFIIPIAFLVVGTVSLTFTVLAGVPTIILVGCTGLILIGLGILALVMRERLITLTNQLGDKLGGWRA